MNKLIHFSGASKIKLIQSVNFTLYRFLYKVARRETIQHNHLKLLFRFISPSDVVVIELVSDWKTTDRNAVKNKSYIIVLCLQCSTRGDVQLIYLFHLTLPSIRCGKCFVFNTKRP